MDFEHDYTETYTTTITRAVGPTTQTGVRGTLPEPSPSDANAIWLAMNGNDANAGTEALPKLTVAGAIAALTAGKPTIHIFRNSYVGDLYFTETTSQTLPASRNIQVEDGEIAELNTSVGMNFPYVLSGGNNVNGTLFSSVTGSGFTPRVRADGTGTTLDNIKIVDGDTGALGNIFYNPLATGNTITVNNSVYEHVQASISTGYSITVNVNNCFIMALNTSPIVVFSQGTVTCTLNISECYIRGSSGTYTFVTNGAVIPYGVINLDGTTGTSVSTINVNIDSTEIEGFGKMFSSTWDDTTDVTTATVTYVLDYCLRKVSFGGDYSTYFPAGSGGSFTFNETITETNTLNSGTLEMYVDKTDLIDNGNQDSGRLQAIGKATSTGGKYLIDSPLIGAGLAGVDVNPWTEATVFTSRSFLQSTTLTWPPSLYSVKNRFVNAQSANDVHGNLHSSFDALRRTFEFGFGDGNNYANNNDLRKLIAMISDNTSMRFYPRAIGESLFINPVDSTADGTTGTFSNTDNSYTPTIISANPMIRRNWAGFWIILDIGTADLRHYYIDSNDASKFYLVDKLSEGFPSNGAYDFSVEYIVVRSALSDIETTQDNFTQFLYGGAIKEPADSTTLAHELRGYSIALLEGEDLWE